MKDFTLNAYNTYLSAIQQHFPNLLRFDEYFLSEPTPSSFCLIRHDVDRKPKNALTMAEFEYGKGVRSTFFFRTKKHTFIPELIKKIADLGHEIGYHYENLSDSNGDMHRALQDFAENLSALRTIYPIKTIAMHGRPLKPYNNSDMWRNPVNHDLLLNQCEILGDAFLDIDYSDIAYINDTGRNWTSTKSNVRDKVDSSVPASFNSGVELYQYLSTHPHPKMVFQIHPERWSSHPIEYCIQYTKDTIINCIKWAIT